MRHLRETAGTLADMGASLSELRGLGLIAPVEAPAHPVARVEPASRASQPQLPGAPRWHRNVGQRVGVPWRWPASTCSTPWRKSLRHADGDIREQLRQATTRPALLDAFEICRGVAAEVGVAHVESIEREFFQLLPAEDEA